jgi:hypothetical protein
MKLRLIVVKAYPSHFIFLFFLEDITLHFTVVTPRYFQLKGGSTTYLEGHKSVLLHPSASIALEQSMEIRSLEVGAYCDLK